MDVKVTYMLVFVAYRREYAWHRYRRLDFSMFNRVLAVGLKLNHMLAFVAYPRECAWHMYRRLDFSMFNHVLALGPKLNHMISVHIYLLDSFRTKADSLIKTDITQVLSRMK